MTTIDELLEPKRTAVWLTSEEIGLIRAGLAAHSIALRGTDPKYTELAKQQMKVRVLSIALGEVQRELDSR